MDETWPRPVPTVGDRSSSAERAADPQGWRLPDADRAGLLRVIEARRDIRRFRPDPVPPEVVRSLLAAAHAGPSVGHSQPWRFVVVADPTARARAATLADAARIRQAAALDPDSGRHLMDLDLEGIREAPLGVVVCCDRRSPAAGVLGRATFTDADMWSCACAIENLWLAARAEGLGVGWVTLFEPEDLTGLVGAPDGVATLGWLCVGWPDERPPSPGLERRGWSERLSLDDVVLSERWPESGAPTRPRSRLAGPDQTAVVSAHDTADVLLSPPGSLGVLDRIVDRVLAIRPNGVSEGVLVMAAADHPVVAHGVSAYEPSVTRTVVEAALAGMSVGVVAAAQSGLSVVVVDAGVEGVPVAGALHLRPIGERGDLVAADALEERDAARLVDAGAALAEQEVADGAGLIALGEVGVGNTTVAAAMAAGLLGGDPADYVGLGAGSDSATVAKKKAAVRSGLRRVQRRDPAGLLAGVGGAEIAVLTGVVLGAARAGAIVVLDGLATSVSALTAVRMEPPVASCLVAGQRSRESGHGAVLAALGLEPVLDLRLRSGEGVGAAMATGLLRTALAVRLGSARTTAAF